VLTLPRRLDFGSDPESQLDFAAWMPVSNGNQQRVDVGLFETQSLRDHVSLRLLGRW
jgi:hypothetical protein